MILKTRQYYHQPRQGYSLIYHNMQFTVELLNLLYKFKLESAKTAGLEARSKFAARMSINKHFPETKDSHGK